MSKRASRVNPGTVSAGLAVLTVVLMVIYNRGVFTGGASGPLAPGGSAGASSGTTAAKGSDGGVSGSKPALGGEDAIVAAFRDERSDVLVEFEGEVIKLLPADNDGKPHQRFIVRMGGGHTVLVAHNLELAPRVPLERGDSVRVRGEYEWNAQGGVVHWTHDDPARRHPGGWIEHEGTKYE
jgi:hypothetical protein